MENINPELWHIAIMGLSGILFAVGGSWITDKIPGQKWVRRILLPVALAAILNFALDVETWRCIAFLVSSFGALSLGYGDDHPFWSWKKLKAYPKWFTALMTPLPILFIGWHPVIAIYPVFFMLVLAGAYRDAFKDRALPWKVFEFMAGCGFGACLVTVLFNIIRWR